MDVRDVAETVREEFEQQMLDRSFLVRLYESYADVGDTQLFITRALDSFPKGNCGVATLYLQSKLGGELRRCTYEGNRHTVLSLEKNTIVDITADQFGGPRVYVGPLKGSWSDVCAVM